MKVRWTPEARLERRSIVQAAAASNPLAAVRLDQQFSTAAERLGQFPHMGRTGPGRGTREIFPHETYRLVYEIADDTVWIVALIHISRKWPPTLD